MLSFIYQARYWHRFRFFQFQKYILQNKFTILSHQVWYSVKALILLILLVFSSIFIFSLVYDIKLFFISLFIISSISIDDGFHFVFVVSNTIADWLIFHIVIIISFFVFVRRSKFFCFSFFKLWVIKTKHQALTLSFDVYAFFVFCNNNSTNWVSNSNIAHHFASFSKCFIISNIECFDEYQYSEYDSQSQYCSNKCFLHIFSCSWYKYYSTSSQCRLQFANHCSNCWISKYCSSTFLFKS